MSNTKTHVRDSSGPLQHVDEIESVGRKAGGGQVGDDGQRRDLGLSRDGGGEGHDHHGRKNNEPNWIEKKKYIFPFRLKMIY